MPVEWVSISAAVIPFVRKYAAETAAKLAAKSTDHMLANTYRRLLPDDRLLKANEAFLDRFRKELTYTADLPTINAEAYSQALRSFLSNDIVQDELQRPLDGQSSIDWELLRGIWAESGDANGPLISLPDDFDWKKLALMYQVALRKLMLSDPQYCSIVQAVEASRSVELTERIAIAVERIAPNPR